ncbi:ATP-binding protein [Streptomyces racemochromogenes]|uniref:ATP-binding protein n=1 Tax=Streptomyces racemochromogenes TaxID=67353 RepID=UPI0031ECFB61
MHLTALRYQGNVRVAVEVLNVLVDNALRHGTPMPAPDGARIGIRLALISCGGLAIEVRDLVGAFPQFDAAVRGEFGRGLWAAGRAGAQFSWCLHDGADSKTVRAELPASRNTDV